MTEALEEEVFVLHADDKPKAIVCAVPYGYPYGQTLYNEKISHYT